MPNFTVTNIINGNTIEVNPGWKFSNGEGNRVVIAGYRVTDQYESLAAAKLTTLLKGKSVELKNATTVATVGGKQTLTCSVYLNEVDVSKYFPELQNPNPYTFT